MLVFNFKKSDYFLGLFFVCFYFNSFSQTVIPSGTIQLKPQGSPNSTVNVATIENSPYGNLRFLLGAPQSGTANNENTFRFVISSGSKSRVVIGSANYSSNAGGLLNVEGGIVADGVLIGEKNGKYAMFGHKNINSLDVNNFNNYALLQENNGETYLNSGNSRPINFRVNNIDKFVIREGSLASMIPMYANAGVSVGGGLLAPNSSLTVRGRTVMIDEGVPGVAFKNINSQFYKNYLLWVHEGIVAEDVAIAKTEHWPDYVFEKDYKLNTINDLENFIKENGHLPTMPSALEVEDHGFTVSDITKRTVKTIEELTLHAIEQHKLIEKQALLIQALESRINALEKKK